MALYLVGDIQGCYKELTALLSQASFDQTKDTLYLAGDLVARGPDSLDTLRFIKSLGESAKIVLGNHDLHLLAVHAGIKNVKAADNLASLLMAPDVDELMDWLVKQPLIQKISDSNAYMSHAGITPQWDLSTALTQANFVHKRLVSNSRSTWLSHMYGEEPNSWENAKTEIEKFRYSINALTRMRYCFKDGSLEFTQKKSPKNPLPHSQLNNKNIHETNLSEVFPWYELSKTINHTTWIFGHWASLMGESSHTNIYPLDTGCVWGNHLTMLRWHDKKIFTQKAEKITNKL